MTVTNCLNKRAEVGRAGERAAARHLMLKGYRIIESNRRNRWGETDLIARKGDLLLFAEVRTRCGDTGRVKPEETLTGPKLHRVRRNAEAYAAWRRWEGPCRIDAICVVLALRRFPPGYRLLRLSHYENIIA